MVAEKVVVQLVLDTSRYSSGAKTAARDTAKIQSATDKTSKSVSGLGATALKAGAALGVAFTAKAALDFAKSSIAAFSNLEESINAVQVSFGGASKGVLALGKNSAEQFGLSTRAVNDAAVAMSAFAEKINEADPADAFENVLQRATDFASVMNLDVEEALLVFRSGLAGESEPLRKFGIDVSAATVNTVGLAAGLGGVNGKLSEGEKVQARYLAIMEQTAKTAGDFANTSDGLANRQRILSAQWEEMQATIGKELEPAMTKLLGAGTKLIPIIGLIARSLVKFIDQAQPAIDLVAGLADALGTLQRQADETAEASGASAEEVDAITQSALDSVNPVAAAVGELQQMGRWLGIVGEEAKELTLQERVLRIRTVDLKESIEDTANAMRGTGFPEFTSNVTVSGVAASTAAERYQAQADAIRDVALAIAESVNPTLRLLGAQERSVAAETKLIGSRQAVVEAEKDLAKARGKDRVVAEEALAAAQRDAQAAVLDATGAQVDLEQATANAAGTIVDARDSFIELTIAAGGTRAEAEALLITLGSFPTVMNVDIFATFRGFERLEQIERLMGGTGSSRGGRDIQLKRHGGPVTADEPFLVGEGGPELFIPDRTGRIIPNNQLGGQSIVVNVNDSTTTDLAADLSAGLIAAQITQQVEMLRV